MDPLDLRPGKAQETVGGAGHILLPGEWEAPEVGAPADLLRADAAFSEEIPVKGAVRRRVAHRPGQQRPLVPHHLGAPRGGSGLHARAGTGVVFKAGPDDAVQPLFKEHGRFPRKVGVRACRPGTRRRRGPDPGLDSRHGCSSAGAARGRCSRHPGTPCRRCRAHGCGPARRGCPDRAAGRRKRVRVRRISSGAARRRAIFRRRRPRPVRRARNAWSPPASHRLSARRERKRSSGVPLNRGE